MKTHNRILQGETTYKDAIWYRTLQVVAILLGIGLILSWIF